MLPLISVVIPFYKNKIWLKEAIESVIAQTYSFFEIILINDGSQENIDDIRSVYKDKLIYIYQKNNGAASARNKGISIAKGEYIAFLDSDDLWKPKKLENQIKYMIEKKLIWSHTGYCKFRKNGIVNEINLAKYKGNIFPICIISCPIATPCVMIKSEVLKENSNLKFLEGLNAGEDTYFWMKLSIKYNIGFLNESLTMVRIRDNNTAKLAYEQLKARTYIWNYIKKSNELKFLKLSLNTKVAFKICNINFKILKKINRKIIKDNSIEFLAKFFYLIPWICFKLSKKRILRKELINENFN